MSSTAPHTTIILVRHGDRYDYADKAAWALRAEKLGLNAVDPPLSALGHAQARETAAELAKLGIDAILSSPYLRVLQTCQPLAHLTGMSICVEDGLAEFPHTPGAIAPARQRVPFVPEIDDEYHSMHTVTTESGARESSGSGGWSVHCASRGVWSAKFVAPSSPQRSRR